MGLGNKRINSSIGSRWKTRINNLQKEVEKQVSAKKLNLEQKKKTNMNAKLNM